MIRGQKKSFQCIEIEKIPNAVMAGIAVGTITRQMSEYSPNPSSLAASMRSSGTDMKNWRNRKMPNTEMMKGMHRPA